MHLTQPRFRCRPLWAALVVCSLLIRFAGAQVMMGDAPQAKVETALNYTALQPGQQAVLAIMLDVPPGLHAQSSKPLDPNLIAFEIALDKSQQFDHFAPVYPPGEDHTYPALGKMNVYEGRVIAYVPIQVKSDAKPGPITIKGTTTYQMCDDSSCFPPESPPFEVKTQLVAAGQPVEANRPELFAGFDPTVWSQLRPPDAGTATPATTQKAETLFGFELGENAYALAFAGAFLIGIIFNVVPCVLPVLPLKAMGFYEVAQHDRAKCLSLGIVFGLGIIATFGALALPVLVFRSLQWGEMFGNPWFAGAMTLLLIAFAVGQFGAFGVNLPTSVYRFTPRHDTYTGNFLFGIFTAILSTPCTFGMFLLLLTWALLQPALVGVLLLMTVGAGMAFPYVLLSGFPELARRFPRTGPWPEVVKQMMAFLLLATAVYFGQMFLPTSLRGPNIWWVMFGLVAAAGVFLVVRAIQIAPRAMPVAIAVAVALLLVAPALAVTVKLANPPLTWTYYDEAALAKARAQGRPVIVKFTATWCANCHTVEATVFGDKMVVDYLQDHRIVPIKADLTSQSAPGWALLRQLHPVGAIPFTAIYLPGEEKPRTLAGIYSTEDLMEVLEAPAPTAAAK